MLTREAVEERRNKAALAEDDRVIFRVAALYGLSKGSLRMPISKTEGIESGQVCVTMDPESDPSGNIGAIDFSKGKLKVRYAAQMVFPGLFELVSTRKHASSLLAPVRAVATDDCTLNPEATGWHALGCLDFLPGSLWAGASGG